MMLEFSRISAISSTTVKSEKRLQHRVLGKSLLPGLLIGLSLTGCFQAENVSGGKSGEAASEFERNTSDPSKPGYSPIRVGEKLRKPGADLIGNGGSVSSSPLAKTAVTGTVGVLSRLYSTGYFLMDAQNATTSTLVWRYTGIAPFPWTTNDVNQDIGRAGVSAPNWSGNTGRDVRINFRAITMSSLYRVETDYAVLRLSGSCPDNGYPFARIFDNEDTNNHNSYSGSISPSTMTTSPHHGETRMEFCFVPKAATGSPRLPNGWLGAQEGVFVRQGYGALVGNCPYDGRIMIDDEDYYNGNSWDWYGMSNDYIARVRTIMRSPHTNGDYDTEMFFCEAEGVVGL